VASDKKSRSSTVVTEGAGPDGVKVYPLGLRRGITRTLRPMIRRRSAIEPAIGHMEADGKLDRNWLKGALGDAINAVLCGASHNLRMILRKLRRFGTDYGIGSCPVQVFVRPPIGRLLCRLLWRAVHQLDHVIAWSIW